MGSVLLAVWPPDVLCKLISHSQVKVISSAGVKWAGASDCSRK